MQKTAIKLSLIYLSIASSLPAADKSATNTPAAIPWNQIGAKAGADYQGDGLAVTPTETGAQLHCTFQRLDAEATTEGLWLTSTVTKNTTERFRVTATAIGRTENFGVRRQSDLSAIVRGATVEAATPLSAAGNVTINGQTVRFTRPGLTEEYSVSMDGFRQDFIVEQPPAGREVSWSAAGLCHFSPSVTRTGELIVKLSVTGATVQPTPNGARLVLENSGRKIAYTRLHVTDATGKELPAHIEICPVGDEVTSLKPSDFLGDDFETMNPLAPEAADPQLAIVINDSDAIYPLRIDPTFSDANWISISQYPGANGCVWAAVMDGSGNLYIGGNFSGVGAAVVNSIARWDGTNWSTLGSGMDGQVNALAVSGSTLYAGGGFTNAGGVPANYLAQWDGTNWSALGSGMNGSVDALAVAGSTLYAAGNFTNAGGVAANCIALWNGSNWSALGSGMNGQVNALAVSGNTLYAGGEFTNAGGVSANYVAQWNGSSWSALGLGLNGWVDALALSGGTLYVGGGFSTAGDTTVTNIAQWDGSTWSTLGSGFNNQVNALVAVGNTVYAGGYFTMVGSVPAGGIAQWDGSSWSAFGSGLGGGYGAQVNALAVSGNTIYAGGCFATAGGAAADNIAEWNGTNWSPMGSGIIEVFSHGFAPTYLYALAASGNTLYAGGQFNYAGGVAANGIAQWNGSAWSALGSGANGYVAALAAAANTAYAAGNFSSAGGVAANNIAQWNGSNWSALGSGLTVPYYRYGTWVVALAASGNTLYAGGGFTNAGGVTANYIAQWDGTNWSALGSGVAGPAPPFTYVTALAVSGNTVYAGGNFTNAGGVAANNIAQWNGSSWSALGSGVNSTVYALAVSGGILYASGSFTNAGGVTANYLAEWDGTNWSALGSGVNNNVNAIAVVGNNLYAGGLFTSAGGVAANYIAQWNGNGWSPLGSGVNNNVTGLAVSGNTLYVGGDFTIAGANECLCVAEAILPISVSILTTDGNFGFTNGIFGFDISGPPGSNVVIQSSTDLQSWTPLQTNSLGSGILYFPDPQPPAATQRFYRAQLSP